MGHTTTDGAITIKPGNAASCRSDRVPQGNVWSIRFPNHPDHWLRLRNMHLHQLHSQPLCSARTEEFFDRAYPAPPPRRRGGPAWPYIPSQILQLKIIVWLKHCGLKPEAPARIWITKM